jgi:hypothetical protein
VLRSSGDALAKGRVAPAAAPVNLPEQANEEHE